MANGSGLSFTVNEEERAEIRDLAERKGGLSYKKLVLMLVREEVKRLAKR